MTEHTDFGFSTVTAQEKTQRVRGVFDSVAQRYDVMNDLMSAGLHRLWKLFLLEASGIKRGDRVLDVASGTGDVAHLFAQRVGDAGSVWLTDINAAMLERGRDRLLDQGVLLPLAQCSAEQLPFPANYFSCVSIAFGLRNVTHKEKALYEMYRVLHPGGVLLILEFSQVWSPLQPIYDWYSFKVLPQMGKWVVGDADSYRYLAESIRMHPDQASLAKMMQEAGFEKINWWNLAAGVVAVHRGYKF